MRTPLGALALMAAALQVAAAPPSGDGFRSSTAAYTPYRESGIADWRMANEAMGPMSGRMGHSGHMGDGGHTVPAPEKSGMNPAQPASGGMGGHHPHMGGKP